MLLISRSVCREGKDPKPETGLFIKTTFTFATSRLRVLFGFHAIRDECVLGKMCFIADMKGKK